MDRKSIIRKKRFSDNYLYLCNMNKSKAFIKIIVRFIAVCLLLIGLMANYIPFDNEDEMELLDSSYHYELKTMDANLKTVVQESGLEHTPYCPTLYPYTWRLRYRILLLKESIENAFFTFYL